MFILVDCGTGQRYVIPAEVADESTIRLLLTDRQEESLTVDTDGFGAYELLEENDAFSHEYVVHGDGEYANDEVHVNTCKGTVAPATVALAASQCVLIAMGIKSLNQ